MSEAMQLLTAAVQQLQKAEERSATLCDECGAAHSLAVLQARSLVAWRAQQVVEEAKVTA